MKPGPMHGKFMLGFHDNSVQICSTAIRAVGSSDLIFEQCFEAMAQSVALPLTSQQVAGDVNSTAGAAHLREISRENRV